MQPELDRPVQGEHDVQHHKGYEAAQPADGADQAGEDETQGDSLGHVWRVDRGEGETVVAQLAALFLAVPATFFFIDICFG